MTEIKLDLSRHCVETEIRRQYNRALSVYFKPGADRKTLEGRIVLLQNALERLDFNFLRSTYPALAGKSAAEVVLSDEAETGLAVLLEGTALNLR